MSLFQPFSWRYAMVEPQARSGINAEQAKACSKYGIVRVPVDYFYYKELMRSLRQGARTRPVERTALRTRARREDP